MDAWRREASMIRAVRQRLRLSYRANASVISDSLDSTAERMAASSSAIAAPWARKGSIGWAASPMRVMEPFDQFRAGGRQRPAHFVQFAGALSTAASADGRAGK